MRRLAWTLVAVLLLGLSPALGQADSRQNGRVRAIGSPEKKRMRPARRLPVPAPTERGVFTGTWTRIGPGERQMVHIRHSEEQGWELRLVWRTAKDFAIDTAWQARSQFSYRGHEGTIELEVDQERSNDAQIVARYRREQRGDRDSLLVEAGELVLHRSDDQGRTLSWHVETLSRELTVGEALYPDEARQAHEDRVLWILAKQAERLIRWDEVYW